MCVCACACVCVRVRVCVCARASEYFSYQYPNNANPSIFSTVINCAIRYVPVCACVCIMQNIDRVMHEALVKSLYPPYIFKR